MGWKVAVVGATGQVGREMLNILAERQFPADEVVALASPKSIGTEVSYGETTLKVKSLEDYDFRGTDIALFSAGGSVSAKWAPKVAAAGAVVIDNSSHFRMEPGVPLVVPEVNAGALAGYAKKNIIANPNCSTAQLVVALKPLHDFAKIRRVVVSTYQSVSGAGNKGMDELFNQTKALYVNDTVEPKKFPKQIAFNVIPHIDVFMDDGFTKEEWKMTAETRKILDPDINLVATCVRVPVFVGHSESVNIEFENPITVDQAREILREAPGLMVVDRHEDGGYITPLECVGDYATFVSRIRRDPTVPDGKGLALWCVSDNLRKGAALNAVQIAEILIARHLKKAA
ncbi:aspartate-semialdehyde dehydrogenase [Zavarzinia aquatilis]|uniref:Aspartate-semialdehyde dehydrogenase n=1 Tax=Zavarzinia aquatilis TaxID=2211142 RepID=A0A317E040_9PROT|nr:aspartate-semialdehyde dehydrogenase [Zavarzinia aquatilis]PWR20349.1 aspartate-semialdehyde dehydrogenase [Zavarzinia aquatilis]